jgi:integrase
LAHLAAGRSFDSRHPAILLVLKGVARTKTELPAQSAPLRAATLAAMLATLADSPRDDRRCRDHRDAAILALGYCFALRRSELAGLDLGHLGSGSGILVMAEAALEIHLARAKAHSGEPKILVVPRAGNRLAVAAIERWIHLAQTQTGQPVLRRVFKSGDIGSDRLDPQSIALVVKHRVTEHLAAQGVPQATAEGTARSYSGHSLRVGFAVTSAEAGADVGAIQRALGHKSPQMAARYSRAARLALTSPHLLPGVGLDRDRRRRKKRRSTE